MLLNVLGVICSPRRRGNTARIVESVLEGARKKGADTETFHLCELEVNPCRACSSCEATGRCFHEDDMESIYDSLSQADALVWGTPIYYDHVSAQAKAFIDRLYVMRRASARRTFPVGMKGVFVITYELDSLNGYDSVLEWIAGMFEHYHGVEMVATLRAHNTTKAPVSHRSELLREAVSIGEILASLKG